MRTCPALTWGRMGTSFPGDSAGVPNFRAKCPSEFLQSGDWGSEWFVAHIFTSSFRPPAHPGCRKCWVWHQVCLTSPLTPPGVVSCCPRRISNSSCLRCSSLEENSGGKPTPGGLQWLWEEHPKEPLLLAGVRAGDPALPPLDTPPHLKIWDRF